MSPLLVGPASPGGSAGEIHVWVAPLDLIDESPLECMLSDDELRRADAAPSASYRRRFMYSRGVLRDLLSRYLRRKPADIELETNAFGRPSLAAPVASALDFNISHAQGWLALAFGWARRVGIDVELLDRRIDWRSVARRGFSRREQECLDALPEEERARAFLRGWLRKEAYSKARGEGFAYGFANFSVSLVDPIAGSSLAEDARDPTAVHRWWIRDLQLDRTLGAALALEGRCDTIRCWRYEATTTHQFSGLEIFR